MTCPCCNKDVLENRLFCPECEIFMPNPQAGKMAGLFRRWLAFVIDPVAAVILYFVLATFFGGIAVVSGIGTKLGAIFIVTVAYGIIFLYFLSKGMTPGKFLLGEQVVESRNGNPPGIFWMILREIIGKFFSGLFLGLGYFWAIWDKDRQAWHDKIAETVVVKRKQF